MRLHAYTCLLAQPMTRDKCHAEHQITFSFAVNVCVRISIGGSGGDNIEVGAGRSILAPTSGVSITISYELSY